jgi:hypothetical protein
MLDDYNKPRLSLMAMFIIAVPLWYHLGRIAENWQPLAFKSPIIEIIPLFLLYQKYGHWPSNTFDGPLTAKC